MRGAKLLLPQYISLHGDDLSIGTNLQFPDGCLSSCLGRFATRDRFSGTQCAGSWVQRAATPNVLVPKEKFFIRNGNSSFSIVSDLRA
jgi:hypothetical protein